jgi:hypothetical protein
MSRKYHATGLRFDPIPYLLSPRQPAWVRCQTHMRLLKASAEDPEVIKWRDRRDSSSLVLRIRAKQNRDGWFPCMPWMHIHEYYFHRLLEMGYDLTDEAVGRAAKQLLDYQLPDGGYMHPAGPRLNAPDPRVGWAACMTGYVVKALLDLGLGDHPNVLKALEVMKARQLVDGGWSCRDRPCVDECNCIISGTPWVFACLVQAGMIHSDDQIAQKAIDLFARFKGEIVRHGYQSDRCFRCDEALVLASLRGLGLSARNRLISALKSSLAKKQHPDGYWLFRGKRSSWYTIEATLALHAAENTRLQERDS